MKIAFTSLNLPAGKTKYHDEIFVNLAKKFRPAKLSPYYFEFLPDAYNVADVIAIAHDHLLDLLIPDIDKVEGRLSRSEDPSEKNVLKKCLEQLQSERPVCDLALDEDEYAIANALRPLSLTPTLVLETNTPDPNTICLAAMEKAGTMFFYTAGKQEVHAWLVDKGSNAVTCAGKIHSDLARGFIKAEIVSYDDLMNTHSMQDARSKGYTRLLDRDELIPENTILEIRFNI